MASSTAESPELGDLRRGSPSWRPGAGQHAAGLGPRDADACRAAPMRAARSPRRSTRSRTSGSPTRRSASCVESVAAQVDGDAESDVAAIVRVVRRDHERAARIPRRADRRDGARDGRRAARLGGGARDRTSRRFQPAPRAQRRAAPRARGLLPGGRASLRRAARRLRAGRDRRPRCATVFATLRARPRPAGRGDRRAPASRPVARAASPTPASARSRSRWRAASATTTTAWRIDDAMHPFSMGIGAGDLRVTVALVDEDDLAGIFAVLHEVGHGLYEQRVDPALARTTLGTRRLARHARVAEPAVGEPGRPLARVLEPLAPACAQALPAARRRRPRRLPARVNVVRADADPRRGRRGDLRAPRHPALRARGRARRGTLALADVPRPGTTACATCSA